MHLPGLMQGKASCRTQRVTVMDLHRRSRATSSVVINSGQVHNDHLYNSAQFVTGLLKSEIRQPS